MVTSKQIPEGASATSPPTADRAEVPGGPFDPPSEATNKAGIIEAIRAHPLIALVVIIVTSLTSVLTTVNLAIEVKRKAHSFYGAQELSDQYYACIRTESLAAAKQIERDLTELAIKAAAYQLASQTLAERGQYGVLSSNISIGFGPNQIVSARHPHEAGQWIVGIDLQSEQGEFQETAAAIERIRRVVDNIEHEFSDGTHPLRQLLSKSKAALMTMTPEYFSGSDYEETYGVRPPKE